MSDRRKMKRKGLKRKQKSKVAASGVFADASKAADAEEDRLFQQNKQFMEESSERSGKEPRRLRKDSKLAQATMETRKKFRHGRAIYKSGEPLTPILRNGVKPGLGGRKLPTFFDTTKEIQEASGPFTLEKKKSKFQKEKERLEVKRLKEEEMTANLYKDFVDFFDPVKGQEAGASETVIATDSTPLACPASQLSKKAKLANLNSMVEKMKEHQDSTGTTLMEDYVPPASEEQKSTNIYVGNLSSSVTEESLTKTFGKYGALVSVKIMWPRGEEQKHRPHNCGFVAFRYRTDAEEAFFELDNQEIQGSKINLDWGKPLKDIGAMRLLKNAVPSGESLNVRSQPKGSRFTSSAMLSAASLRERSRCHDPVQPNGIRETITVPLAKKDIFLLITRAAEFVARDGEAFETLLKEAERLNPDYFWLFNDNCIESIYYRWRVLAYLNGEGLVDYSTEPFRFLRSDRTWFVPPPRPAIENVSTSKEAVDASSDATFLTCMEACQKLRKAAEKRQGGQLSHDTESGHRSAAASASEGGTGASKERRKRGVRLKTKQKERFYRLLGRLTLQRTAIAQVMGFCFDFVECARDCVAILLEPFEALSLFVESTSSGESEIGQARWATAPALLLTRLYCLSDVLFNSNAAIKKASLYRSLIQEKLPLIFHVLGLGYKKAAGRLTAQAIHFRVFAVLTAWKQKFLLSPRFLVGLRVTFRVATELGPVNLDQTGFQDLVSQGTLLGIYTKGKNGPELKALIEEVEAESMKGEGLKTDSILFETSEQRKQAEERHVAESKPVAVLDLDAAEESEVAHSAEADVDGEPMDSDIDGEPLESDVDGEPVIAE